MGKHLTTVMIVVGSVGVAVLVTWVVTSSEDEAPTTEEQVYLRSVAKDPRVLRVDYSAIPDRDLIDAGYEVCRRLDDEPGLADGVDLERFSYEIRDEFAFRRARPEPGAEQDPGVPLRNADLRLAFAAGDAATHVLCAEVRFNPAR